MVEKIPKVAITKKCLEQVKEATKDMKNESCALLLGKESGEQVIIMEVSVAENAHEFSRVAFLISPEDIVRAVQIGKRKAMSIVGVLHSHPASYFARPSPVDVEQMIQKTENRSGVWLITNSKEINAFVCCGNCVYQVPLFVLNTG